MRVRRDASDWPQCIVGRECESAHLCRRSLGRSPAKKNLNLDGAPAFRESGDGTIGDGPLELSLTATRFEWAERPRASRLRRARPRAGRRLGDPGHPPAENFRMTDRKPFPQFSGALWKAACLRLSPRRSRGPTQWSRRSAAVPCCWHGGSLGLTSSRDASSRHGNSAGDRRDRDASASGRRRESRHRTRSNLRARRRPPLGRATVGPANSARRGRSLRIRARRNRLARSRSYAADLGVRCRRSMHRRSPASGMPRSQPRSESNSCGSRFPWTRPARFPAWGATDKHGSVDIRNLKLEGDRLTWSQTVTKPLRLNLEFDIVVTGEALMAPQSRSPAAFEG